MQVVPVLLNLQKLSNVRVNTLLLQQVVVSLLEVLESQLLSTENAVDHDQLYWDVELDASFLTLLVSLEDQVNQHLELVSPLLSCHTLCIVRLLSSEWIVLLV